MIVKLQEKLKNTEEKIEKLKKKERIELAKKNSTDALRRRRERVHHLISLGGLFEIVDMDKNSPGHILGFLMTYKKDFEGFKEEFIEIGNKELLKRKDKRDIKNKGSIEKSIEIEQISELLKISSEKNKDVIHLMQNYFKKNLLENLSQKEYLFLKNELLK